MTGRHDIAPQGARCQGANYMTGLHDNFSQGKHCQGGYMTMLPRGANYMIMLQMDSLSGVT